MDENRAQAYLNLIQSLLNCRSDEELQQRLQANSELLDMEFLHTCEQVAATLAEQGQENQADFLRWLISQLRKDYSRFLRQLLRTIIDSQGNPQQVYSLLRRNLDRLDLQLVEVLTAWATDALAKVEPTQANVVAANIFKLANLFSDFPLGSKLVNLEIAIGCYNIIANVYTRKDFPQHWATLQNILADAYNKRIKGSRADNLEQAIACYEMALTFYTREDFPELWAGIQNNLANAYKNRIKGSRADNQERAIVLYEAALTVSTREDFPELWAGTQNNLANAYNGRIKGSRADNLEWAIGFYKAALTVYTREDFPEDWALTQNNLALTYNGRINGSRADNQERAIALYEVALTVRTREAFPEQWAETQNNLALAYTNRIKGSRADNQERAIALYEVALTVRTRENSPEQWADTHNNLALAYSDRINGSRADNLERAIALYEAALTVRTPEDFSQLWAETQNLLAVAYCERTKGSRADNLERAIGLYENALTIRTRQAFPQEYTETLSNLGYLYRSNQQWQLAYDTYAPAIETVEFLRGEIQSGDETKQKLAEEYNRIYLSMVEVCIQLQRYTEAVEFAERSKGQNLIELLSVKDLYPKGEIPPEVRQELQQLRLRIAEENQRLKQTEEKNHDIINQLRQDLAAKYPYTHLKFDKIKQLADKKTAIIEWYILGSSFCVFIITNDNSQPQFLSFPESDLDRLIDWTMEYLEDYYSNRQQWQNSLETQLANLAQILHIDEIVNSLPKTCDKLILIPHRYLHLFPLHALPVTHKTFKYLIDAFPGGVSYSPSCQILHQVQKYEGGKFDRFFAIQNPTEDLMAADMEVETIKNIFPNSEIFSKENAKKGEQSEETLEIAERVANSHHLFFSCHGFFDPNDSLKSGLLLADGTLTLEEIFRYFNLSECSLVTLSACETGQVQLDNTDEYISLTSGFLLAGSPSLYVSLWSVNSLSTAILLIKTYENLYHQPGKFALALSQAQIWMRDTDIQGFLDWTNQCHLLDTEWREILQYCLEEDKATQGVCAKIYQNPYHWAGFSAAGKGEQNMTNSSNKIEIFQQLIQSDFYFNLRYALVSLKAELTDNDDNNVELIENWLQDKPALKLQYKANVMKSEEVKLPNKGQSPTKPGQQSQSLKETLENLIIAAEKPPEANQDTPSSP